MKQSQGEQDSPDSCPACRNLPNAVSDLSRDSQSTINHAKTAALFETTAEFTVLLAASHDSPIGALTAAAEFAVQGELIGADVVFQHRVKTALVLSVFDHVYLDETEHDFVSIETLISAMPDHPALWNVDEQAQRLRAHGLIARRCVKRLPLITAQRICFTPQLARVM